MQLVRWYPFQELDSFERRVRRLIEDAGIAPAPLPAADVYETESEYVFELEVPGFEEKQLSVAVADHTLTIKGERKEEKEEEKEEEGKTFRLHERLAREFERRFELPPEADSKRVAADFKAGVLTVHAPKAKEAEPRNVAIAAK